MRGASCRLAVCLVAWPLAAAGQTIDADRPGLTFAGSVLPAGRVQVELAALELARRADGGERSTHLAFPSVVRVGLGRALELQVGHALVQWRRTADGTSVVRDTGAGDLGLGVKFARPATAAGPGVVLAGSLTLPTGTEPFTADAAGVSAHAQAGWSLARGFSIGGIAGYARTFGDDTAGTGTVGVSLGVPMPETWAAYVEAGFFPVFAGAGDGAHLGGGIARFLGERIQLDAFLNRGLTAASADWTAGAGFSFRF